ncbi:MAG: FAD-dependent oxidoreductase [Acidimicrobiia bacterium]|nr:FAD-dependent oxidoreductase [Acidimicrobiia bacterium]MYC45097.1 FAD-dependent oxidoreductase [Acidimicrobiia bacterium]MYI20306.1 FAD-dependent oxidoreductase [Acidimicrobiia bacterium]
MNEPARDPRFDVLFERVRIGPIVAKNRFFQVPHCNGMGYRDASAHAEMRAVKAQGGWAVVCTEQAEIHHSSEITPYIEARIWDDQDIPALALVADRIHEHGALAGIELCYNGLSGLNLHSRVAPRAPSALPVISGHADPVQAREMTKRDIANVRRWHRQAVDRSLRAGYDLVYVYAAHGLSCMHHFLSPRYNLRSDEYGGSLPNRMRLLREILTDTVEEVAGRAATACRITLDELLGDGITRAEIEEVLGELGEIPDLWDFAMGTWEDDSVTSRFGAEGGQEQYVAGLKALTSKPVVGVGRFTSPDAMVRMVHQGILDFIGAARPSIADPYLPQKIEEGRLEDIRECIGCNICVTGDFTMSPIRCTQNPSMGEEWRRGWHPEVYRTRHADEKILVVGAGPAGLEAAMAAGKRGYEVVLVERSRRLGGRVAAEARLPGLAEWIRVLDYREGQIARMGNVEVYLESPMTADELPAYDFAHVAVATGSTWRRDGVGRRHTHPMRIGGLPILTPDDLMAGDRPAGSRVVIFDDDHFYMGGVLAELLAGEGYDVSIVTPQACISRWTVNTMDQHRIQARLMNLGVELRCNTTAEAIGDDGLELACTYTGSRSDLGAEAAVLVTARLPEDSLLTDLQTRRHEWPDRGLRSARAIGDALAPGTIAAAVWEGRRFAEEIENPSDDADTTPYRREVTQLAGRRPPS